MFVIFVVVAVGTVNGMPALLGYVRQDTDMGVFAPLAVVGGFGGIAAAIALSQNHWAAQNAANLLQTMVPFVGACTGVLLGYIVADIFQRFRPGYRFKHLSEEVMMVGVTAALGLVATLALSIGLFLFSEGMQGQSEFATLVSSLSDATGMSRREIKEDVGGVLFSMPWTNQAWLAAAGALVVSAVLSGAFWRRRLGTS